LKPGYGEIAEAEIIQFCRQSMARFKVPKRIVFGELPKTATGKIQKFALRERASERKG
jgi:fatty-acyl-CoA synthase